MLIKELAEKIIKEIKKLIDENVIVVDPKGFIIASTDPSRIGNFHEGALLALRRKEKLIITKEDQEILQGVKAGINLPVFFQHDVVGVIGITGEPETVSSLGEVIRKMTELLISESYFSDQLDLQLRSLEAFVFDWLQVREWDETFENRAKLLNIDLSLKRQVVLFELPPAHPIVSRDVWYSIFKWNEARGNDIIIRWGNDRFLILLEAVEHKSRDFISRRIAQLQKIVTAHLQIPIYIGVGHTVDSKDIQESFKHAERALKSASIENEIIFDEDLKIEMILDDLRNDTKTAFLNRTIGPILNDVDLIQTLMELFKQNHSLKNTASSLHIHINTLHYRLKKVHEKTGLDPSKIDDLLTIYLGLLILDEHTKK